MSSVARGARWRRALPGAPAAKNIQLKLILHVAPLCGSQMVETRDERGAGLVRCAAVARPPLLRDEPRGVELVQRHWSFHGRSITAASGMLKTGRQAGTAWLPAYSCWLEA